MNNENLKIIIDLLGLLTSQLLTIATVWSMIHRRE